MNIRLQNFLWFALFFAITVLLYLGTVHARFVFDFIDLAYDFERDGWANLGSFSKGFSAYIVAKAGFFVLLKLFGFNAWCWYLLTCALHALNALLLFLFCSRLFNQLQVKGASTAAVITALLFLLSPYHTETIVWGGAFNYLLVSYFILLHLNLVLAYLRNPQTGTAIAALFCFVAAAFSHEWGLLLIPADVLLLLVVGGNFKLLSAKTVWPALAIVAITVLYFANQLKHGSLVGHYGAETHLNLKWKEIVPAYYRYLLKIGLLVGCATVPVRQKIYDTLSQSPWLYVSALALIGTALAWMATLLTARKKYGAALLFTALFTLFVFPVLNLYFPAWIDIHGDRYCYLPAAFLYAALMAMVFNSGKIWRVAVPVAMLAVSLVVLVQHNRNWHQAAVLQQKLDTGFSWWNARQVYILNLPDNYNGAYMYRNSQKSIFGGTFIRHHFFKPTNRVTEVLSYNLTEPADSVTVEKTGPAQLKVTLNKWGIWYWYKNAGAGDYETELLKVDVDDYNHIYTVDFKEKQPGDVFLYQANGQWHVVENF